jgi:hypothetical protein
VTILLADTSNHLMEHLISFIYTGDAAMRDSSDYDGLVRLLRVLGVKAPRGFGDGGGEEVATAPSLKSPDAAEPESSQSSSSSSESIVSEEEEEEDLMLLCPVDAASGDLSLRTLLLRLPEPHNAHKNADVNTPQQQQESQSNLLLSSSSSSSSSSWTWGNESCWPRRTDLFVEEEEEEEKEEVVVGNAEHVQSSFSTVDKSAILYCSVTSTAAQVVEGQQEHSSPPAPSAFDSLSSSPPLSDDNGSLMQSGEDEEAQASGGQSPYSEISSSFSSNGEEAENGREELDLIFNHQIEHYNEQQLQQPEEARVFVEQVASATVNEIVMDGGGGGENDGSHRRRRRLHQCSHCSKRFPSQYYLHFHENSVHSKARTLACTDCSRQFTSAYYLKQHVTRVHSESRPFAW